VKEFVQLYKIHLLEAKTADYLVFVLKQILVQELHTVKSDNEVRVTADVLNFSQDVLMLFEAVLSKIECQRHK